MTAISMGIAAKRFRLLGDQSMSNEMSQFFKKMWNFLVCASKHMFWDEARRSKDGSEDGMNHCLVILTVVSVGFAGMLSAINETGMERVWVAWCIWALAACVAACCVSLCLSQPGSGKRYFNRSTRVCAKWLCLVIVLFGCWQGLAVMKGCGFGQERSVTVVTPEYITHNMGEDPWNTEGYSTTSVTYRFSIRSQQGRPVAFSVLAALGPQLEGEWDITGMRLSVGEDSDQRDLKELSQEPDKKSDTLKSISLGYPCQSEESKYKEGDEECVVVLQLRCTPSGKDETLRKADITEGVVITAIIIDGDE